jgi:hypothetical protein
MRSSDGMTLLGSAFRPRSIHRHAPATPAALLACFSVILNVGLLAHQATRATREQSPIAVTRSHATSGAPAARLRPETKPEAAETIEPSRVLSSLVDDEFARLELRPRTPKAGHGDVQVKETGRDRATFEPVTRPFASIAGIWAPDASACAARYFRDGTLPTIINTDGAWAGDTFCLFGSHKRTEAGWRVVASCSNPHEHWSTEVNLAVKDNRLTWKSKRGVQAYARCTPDFRMAAAR